MSEQVEVTQGKTQCRGFVMPEDEWLSLRQRQCNARRRDKSLWPKGRVDCERDGSCDECVFDAADRVPKKYHTTVDDARDHDPLPGFERNF